MRMYLLLALLLFGVGCSNDNSNMATDRDNTAVNERDADSPGMATPFDQSNEQSDIDLVAKIRSEVVEIDDLSTNGKNVKIITNAGRVILRGPVDSAAERDAIEAVAKRNASDDSNVTSYLEVETD